MKFIYKLLSLSLAIACLSGCSAANTEIASSSAATATVTPTTDSTEVSASNNVFTSAGDGLYVTTDSGIYELQTVFPDSANIFYTDANTKERIFLCANPNCTHADESCPSYIATPSAMFPPIPCVQELLSDLLYSLQMSVCIELFYGIGRVLNL